MAEIEFTKTDLLLAIDAAIGQLVTVRTLVAQVLPDDAEGQVHREDVAPDPHDGHKIIPGGFGEDLFCLDCGVSVGVSGYPDETAGP